jgi:hypothetical protein
MLKFMVAALTFTVLGGVASADHGDDHRDHRDDKRAVAVDHRNNQPGRVNRPAQRANRRVVARRAVYANNGRFVFAGGGSHVYTRPVIHARYYDARVRPQLIVENYSPEPGYVWSRGQWSWSGREWRWGDGHFVPDPQYSNYYDDGSYDYSVNISLGH